MQAGVAAVILDVVAGLGSKVLKEQSLRSTLVMVGAFCATFFFHVNVIFIILAAALIGILTEAARYRKGAGV